MSASAVFRQPFVAALGGVVAARAGSKKRAALLVQRGEAREFVPVERG
jgi:hypothetical protein